MGSSEYGGPDEAEVPLAEADVYKETSNSNYVVIRRVRLFRSKFITFHNFEENDEDRKHWILSSQCDLSPRNVVEIRDPCTKHVRPRGQWAITTLVKPKYIGTRGRSVHLYMFTLSWPTRWAAKGYTSFSFGFEDVAEARHWHMRLHDCLDAIRLEKAAASSSQSPLHGGVGINTSGQALTARMSTGNGGVGAAGSYGRSSTGALIAGAQALQAPGAGAGGGAGPSTGMVKGLQKRVSADGRSSGTDTAAVQVVGITSAASSPEVPERRQSASESAKRTLVYDSNSAAAATETPAAPPPPPAARPLSGAIRGSSFAVATAAAAAAAGLAPIPSAMAAKPSQSAVNLLPQAPPPPPPSSTDSEGSYEELEDVAVSGCVPCRQPRGTSRGDVYHTRQRWVPYKQVNGVAIYHHPQNAGDAEAGVGGEFMVSTVVRGNPRRCLTALTSNCGTTSILGPAIVQEVLQRRQAVDDKEVQRIVIQAPGLAGVICAPRELVVETVLKTDETVPTLMLMFNSCEVPARFVERKAGEQQAEEAEACQAASEGGGQRSWWRRPIAARVRGGYTIAPLSENTLDQSQEALVTCIIKVDLGGVCGERSWFRLAADLAGWTDAFLDRMLMAVTLLRDEVEQARFVVQPLSMMASSSRAKAERPSFLDVPVPDSITAAEMTSVPVRSRINNAVESPRPMGKKGEEEAGAEAGAAPGHEGAAGASGAAAAADMGDALDTGHGLDTLPHPYETLEEVLERMRSLSLLDLSVWDNLHQPGKDAPFKIRGPTYLKDRKKIPAGFSKFILGSMDVIQQPPGALHEHVARFIPAIRQSGAPFSVVVHLVIPGTPLLGIVATFVTDRHPRTLGTPPAQPMEDEHDWEPFDFVLHKYMTGSTFVRNHMLKLIPHIADGSWMIKQSVGTTPVILGKQLKTTYYETPQYLEIDIDISANNVASYVTGLVRGATRSLVIDMGFVLEGTTPWELPEALLGTLRLYHLDIRGAKLIDVSKEIPLRPPNMAPPPPLRGHPYTSVPTSAISGALSTGAVTAGDVSGLCSPAGGAGAATPAPAGSGPVGVGSGGNGNAVNHGNGHGNGNGNGGGLAAAAGAGQSSFTCKLAGAGLSVGGAGASKRLASGLIGQVSAPVNSPGSDSSRNSGHDSRPVSAQQTPLPPRPFVSVSASGVGTSGGAAAAVAEATAPLRS
ncbi:hypothetical protein Vretimale_9010 [Volvox reticuliferus]|uniref:Protein ENHANCED DISEASE RESISTANCE 2 C-terminal domain-containing protein n=1 Tax=Volvox reticuliferus TaxID=1737510 RepID=A0A8J4GCM6_9CHLO|nr:hypothetical protein Vretimale_9010 [Volvox reticuliferus]